MISMNVHGNTLANVCALANYVMITNIIVKYIVFGGRPYIHRHGE